MQLLTASPLLAAESHLDQPAVVGAQATWTWRQIHAASLTLSQRLGPATAVCNLCTSRVSFLVTWLAALRCGALLVLPPSGGSADLAEVLRASADTLVVVDDPDAIQAGWRQSADVLVCQPDIEPSAAAADTLAWRPDWDRTAVLLYTSGSTGTPEAQAKTLRHLATGALALGARLSQDVAGGVPAIHRLICSVPPQHMFGVETSIMLSLVYGIPVLDSRPLLPADVCAAFAASPCSAWIATPLHLRSLVQAGDAVPHCCVVIASTMPLTQTLAQQTERLVDAPVLEIYGSTETGVLAMRRSAHEPSWRLVNDVRLESLADATRAWGSHFASPVTLLDQVELHPTGSFTLVGRQTELIKIAGRRASLAGLNLLLQDLPGLQDGVFYLPSSGSPTERLCLIYAGAPLDRTATEQWLRARVDPTFLPRTLIQVDRLPRGDSGKLPRQALDQLFAQYQAAAPRSTRPRPHSFQLAVPEDHPALPGHFPGRPIVPGVLLLDRILTQVSTALRCPIQSLPQVKFTAALRPGETANVEFEADGPRVRFSVQVQREGLAVPLASGSLLLAQPSTAPR